MRRARSGGGILTRVHASGTTPGEERDPQRIGDEDMAGDVDEMGPIDYIVVEFPGARLTGEAFPLLVDLVDRGLIRIIDLLFVKKELDGTVVGMTIADVDG